MKLIVKKWKMFWDWEDDKQEEWLQCMSLKGLHFVSCDPLGVFCFERGEPRVDRYRLDFRDTDADKAQYLQMFMDAGWELVHQNDGWQYFRQRASNGGAPEIFTDNASKVEKYRRVQKFQAAMAGIMFMLFAICWDPSAASVADWIVTLLVAGLFVPLILVFVVGCCKIEKRIHVLKQSTVDG